MKFILFLFCSGVVWGFFVGGDGGFFLGGQVNCTFIFSPYRLPKMELLFSFHLINLENTLSIRRVVFFFEGGGSHSTARVSLVSRPGIETTAPALEGRVLTSGPLGKP